MIELRPEILRRDGKEQFVIFSWEDYLRIQNMLEDAYDLLDLRRAKAQDDPSVPSISMEAVKARFGIED